MRLSRLLSSTSYSTHQPKEPLIAAGGIVLRRAEPDRGLDPQHGCAPRRRRPAPRPLLLARLPSRRSAPAPRLSSVTRFVDRRIAQTERHARTPRIRLHHDRRRRARRRPRTPPAPESCRSSRKYTVDAPYRTARRANRVRAAGPRAKRWPAARRRGRAPTARHLRRRGRRARGAADGESQVDGAVGSWHGPQRERIPRIAGDADHQPARADSSRDSVSRYWPAGSGGSANSGGVSRAAGPARRTARTARSAAGPARSAGAIRATDRAETRRARCSDATVSSSCSCDGDDRPAGRPLEGPHHRRAAITATARASRRRSRADGRDPRRTRPDRSSARSTSQRAAASRTSHVSDRAEQRQVGVARPHRRGRGRDPPARPSHSSHSAGASRVLNASRPRSTPTTIAEATAVSTTAVDAMSRLTRPLASSVHAAAAGTAKSGRIGAKNRAGGLQPPHHIAKCVTVSR